MPILMLTIDELKEYSGLNAAMEEYPNVDFSKSFEGDLRLVIPVHEDWEKVIDNPDLDPWEGEHVIVIGDKLFISYTDGMLLSLRFNTETFNVLGIRFEEIGERETKLYIDAVNVGLAEGDPVLFYSKVFKWEQEHDPELTKFLVEGFEKRPKYKFNNIRLAQPLTPTVS